MKTKRVQASNKKRAPVIGALLVCRPVVFSKDLKDFLRGHMYL